MNTKHTLAVFAMATLMGSQAYATVWQFDLTPQNGGGPGYSYSPTGGSIKNISSTFDDASQRMTYSATFGDSAAGTLPDGFWLVMNDGPNPKGTSDELAIFYFDAGITNSGGPKLTAYAYNGINGNTSFQDGSNASGTQAPDRIASSMSTSGFVNSLNVTNNSNGTRTMSFDINAGIINSHDPLYGPASNWFGTGFDNNVGIWFHVVDGLDAKYNSAGYLTKFDFDKQGWVDGENLDAVPEPFTMAGLAVLALAAKKRKKS